MVTTTLMSLPVSSNGASAAAFRQGAGTRSGCFQQTLNLEMHPFGDRGHALLVHQEHHVEPRRREVAVVRDLGLKPSGVSRRDRNVDQALSVVEGMRGDAIPHQTDPLYYSRLGRSDR